METIRRLIERPADWLIAFACVVTIVMMFHIVADVFAKYAFNSPIEGTIETVAGYYMVAVVFFPFAYVAYTEGQIVVELFTRGMSKRAVMRLDGVIAIATFLYLAVFAWKTVEEAVLRTAQLEIWETGTSMIPIWPSRWLIPIGCGVMAAHVLYRLVRDLQGQSDQQRAAARAPQREPEVTSLEIGLYSVIVVIALIAARMPIGVALGLVSFVGIAFMRGLDVAYGMLKTVPFDFAAHWELTAIPMFLLMGSIAHHSGISSALFKAARLWLSGLPGGLAVAANFACAGFAAASGSSVATAAAMGRIAIPEMLDAGYDKALATGTVASAGTLGSLIPPSILFVLYGIFAEVSITKLLIAGVFPGLLTAVIYAAMIITRSMIWPEIAPRTAADATRAERYQALAAIWPLLVLIVGIIGGLYSGLVTPTEAGAFGAFLSFVIAALQGRMNWRVLKDSVVEAVASTSRIFFVAVGAVLLTKFLALSGVPTYLGELVGTWALDRISLVIAASLIYLVLGMFLDPLGLLLITLPFLLPMFEALDLDLIWFGVLVIKFLEIGLLTPPVGFNVYVIKSVVGDRVELETIFKGVLWFLACEVVVVVLLVAYPEISLWLPSTMD